MAFGLLEEATAGFGHGSSLLARVLGLLVHDIVVALILAIVYKQNLSRGW